MWNENISSGLRHSARLIRVKDIGSRQHVQFVCPADHLDLQSEAHARLLQVLPEGAIKETNGREVLHTREAHLLELLQKVRHDSEWICATDSCQYWCVLHYRQYLARHLDNNSVGIPIG